MVIIMKKHIVVIDTGVEIDHPVIDSKRIKSTLGVKKDNNSNSYKMVNECIDQIGHGTAVLGILTQECDYDINFSVIKIFGNDEATSIEMLFFALNYVYEHIECDIINTSLGTNIYDKNLESICKKITDKGIIIVSAFSNDGCISYPAGFDSVLGVDISSQCKNKFDYYYVENSPVNIIAMGVNHRVGWKQSSYTIRQGASYSTPYITAIIIRLLSESNSIDEALEKFKNNSIKIINYDNYTSRIKIKSDQKIAAFPYNKEIHSLVNFAEMINGELVDIYDNKYFRNCGKTVTNFIRSKKYIIKNIEDIDWNSFDLLIIGHIKEIELSLKQDIKKTLLEKCLKHNKNVFCFDSSKIEESFFPLFKEKGLELILPSNVPDIYNKGGRLYMMKTPVLGIMGTSNQQAKFTLQLFLRKKLIELGYKVGQLGTEPSSAIFGMESTVHFGYHGTVKKDGIIFVEHINNELHFIDKMDKDIIIVGNQAGTVPRYAYNIDHLRIPELEFLLAANPDCVILCVNIYDDRDYIDRTINAIENIIDTRVIALAVSPMMYKGDWYLMNEKKTLVSEEKMNDIIDEFKRHFNIPAIPILGENNIKKLTQYIIDFFGG